jgi:hypothetical protein
MLSERCEDAGNIYVEYKEEEKKRKKESRRRSEQAPRDSANRTHVLHNH